MEKDTYESIQRELRKIEEEYEQNESMKKRFKQAKKICSVRVPCI